jgi:hypothetical protein
LCREFGASARSRARASRCAETEEWVSRLPRSTTPAPLRGFNWPNASELSIWCYEAGAVKTENDDLLETYSRTPDGELVDTRTPEQEEELSTEILRFENDSMEAEAAAIRREVEALSGIGESNQRVGMILTRLLADGFRLRITIGAHSEVVERHTELSDAFKGWSDSLRPDEDGSYRLGDGEPAEGLVPFADTLQAFVEACQKWSADRPYPLR